MDGLSSNANAIAVHFVEERTESECKALKLQVN